MIHKTLGFHMEYIVCKGFVYKGRLWMWNAFLCELDETLQ